MILTSTQAEADRLKRVLTKYFKHKMKLELSQEKTYVTDLRKDGIHFLGFVVKAERKHKTPDPKTWSDNLVGKPYPDMVRLSKKINAIQDEVRKIGKCNKVEEQVGQIQKVNEQIIGVAQYIQTSICSYAYGDMDRRIDLTALAVWRKMYPKTYNRYQVPIKCLCNLPQRHSGYDSKTFAVKVEGNWFGITYAFITHSNYEKKPFNQKMTPYTAEGRKLYVSYRDKHKPLPMDRPSVNTPEDLVMAIGCKGSHRKYNFEYFMNREYAFNRDKGKCKCCGIALTDDVPRHCHHVSNQKHIEDINKVNNLAWFCIPCHELVHGNKALDGLDSKVAKKIEKYRKKLNP